VLTAQQLLEDEEILLGAYNVSIARWQRDHWVSTLPALYVVLTDHRMILQPHTRKRYQPAIIPRRYLDRVEELEIPYRHGLMVYLKTGHQMGMLVGARTCREMLRDLHKMMTPSSPVRFETQLDLGRLQKIIDYVANL
jgi:hypothetical protein